MVDKTRFGERHTCYACGCKFYDMHRNPPTCPRCGADASRTPLPVEEAALDADVEDDASDPDVEAEDVMDTDIIPPEDEEDIEE